MSIRIMSFNIWGDYFGNPVETREGAIGDFIRSVSPDVIAIQEATKNWHNSALFAELRETYTLANPENAPSNNYVPLLWRTDRFLELECGFEYFHDTPDDTKGVTWSVLEDKSGARLAVMCTHFWWKYVGTAEHDALRVSNARILTEVAARLCAKYAIPAVAMGDLNSAGDEPSLTYLREQGWSFAQFDAEKTDRRSSYHYNPIRGEDGIWRGKPTDEDLTHSIDHIISRGAIKAVNFGIITTQPVLDSSDHSPIFADFE